MADYINREKYCDEICHCNQNYCDKPSCPIWKAPSEDVVPVVYGKWIIPHWKSSTSCANCSVCGREAYHHNYRGVQEYYKFCPYCGAKMDAE